MNRTNQRPTDELHANPETTDVSLLVDWSDVSDETVRASSERDESLETVDRDDITEGMTVDLTLSKPVGYGTRTVVNGEVVQARRIGDELPDFKVRFTHDGDDYTVRTHFPGADAEIRKNGELTATWKLTDVSMIESTESTDETAELDETETTDVTSADELADIDEGETIAVRYNSRYTDSRGENQRVTGTVESVDTTLHPDENGFACMNIDISTADGRKRLDADCTPDGEPMVIVKTPRRAHDTRTADGGLTSRTSTWVKISRHGTIERETADTDGDEPELVADGGVDIARPELQDTSTNARVVVSIDETRDFDGHWLEMETASGHSYTFRRLSESEDYALETAHKPDGSEFGDSYGADLPANVSAILADYNGNEPDTAERMETAVRLGNLAHTIERDVNAMFADDSDENDSDTVSLRETLERITQRNAETYKQRLETGDYGLNTDETAERKEKARVTLEAIARRRVRKLRESPYWVESEYDEIADGEPSKLRETIDTDTATA